MLTFVLAFTLLFETKVAAAKGPVWLAASTEKRILVVRNGATDVKQYDIAVGTKSHPTPGGRYTVRHIVWNPSWAPPNSGWAKGKKATGPDDPKNPMRAVKIFFREPDFYIHGTDNEDSIGHAASHGCIRMTAADAVELARYLMEHGGAHHNDDWYSNAMMSSKPTDVRLPTGIPIAIGK